MISLALALAVYVCVGVCLSICVLTKQNEENKKKNKKAALKAANDLEEARNAAAEVGHRQSNNNASNRGMYLSITSHRPS